MTPLSRIVDERYGDRSAISFGFLFRWRLIGLRELKLRAGIVGWVTLTPLVAIGLSLFNMSAGFTASLPVVGLKVDVSPRFSLLK